MRLPRHLVRQTGSLVKHPCRFLARQLALSTRTTRCAAQLTATPGMAMARDLSPRNHGSTTNSKSKLCRPGEVVKPTDELCQHQLDEASIPPRYAAGTRLARGETDRQNQQNDELESWRNGCNFVPVHYDYSRHHNRTTTPGD